MSIGNVFFGAALVAWMAVVAIWIWWGIFQRSRDGLQIGRYVRVLEPGAARFHGIVRDIRKESGGRTLVAVDPILIDRSGAARVIGARINVPATHVSPL